MATKKELAVAALKHGTVIDHIPVSSLFKVVEILGLQKLSTAVTIGYNLESSRLGTKGIIKVADTFFPEEIIHRIAIVAPSAVVNRIEGYEVVDKQPVVLPDKLTGLVVCNNPKCITRNEPMPSRFTVISREPVGLKCDYCEHEIDSNDISL